MQGGATKMICSNVSRGASRIGCRPAPARMFASTPRCRAARQSHEPHESHDRGEARPVSAHPDAKAKSPTYLSPSPVTAQCDARQEQPDSSAYSDNTHKRQASRSSVNRAPNLSHPAGKRTPDVTADWAPATQDKDFLGKLHVPTHLDFGGPHFPYVFAGSFLIGSFLVGALAMTTLLFRAIGTCEEGCQS